MHIEVSKRCVKKVHIFGIVEYILFPYGSCLASSRCQHGREWVNALLCGHYRHQRVKVSILYISQIHMVQIRFIHSSYFFMCSPTDTNQIIIVFHQFASTFLLSSLYCITSIISLHRFHFIIQPDNFL